MKCQNEIVDEVHAGADDDNNDYWSKHNERKEIRKSALWARRFEALSKVRSDYDKYKKTKINDEITDLSITVLRKRVVDNLVSKNIGMYGKRTKNGNKRYVSTDSI